MLAKPPPESTALSEATRKALEVHRQRVSETLRQLETTMPEWLAKVRKL